MFIPLSGHRLPRRIIQLLAGLVVFGSGIGLMLESELGLPPWDVLHQGLTERFGLSVGVWSILVSVVVLLFWLPLREPYGIGTLFNAIVVGVMIDVTAAAIPDLSEAWLRWTVLLIGIFLVGLASGMYIGANLGPGPRDGLMTGIARRGPSIRLTRTALELAALAIGWLLGGTFGIGTVIYALAMGPLVQFFLPRWAVDTGLSDEAWVHPAR